MSVRIVLMFGPPAVTTSDGLPAPKRIGKWRIVLQLVIIDSFAVSHMDSSKEYYKWSVSHDDRDNEWMWRRTMDSNWAIGKLLSSLSRNRFFDVWPGPTRIWCGGLLMWVILTESMKRNSMILWQEVSIFWLQWNSGMKNELFNEIVQL